MSDITPKMIKRIQSLLAIAKEGSGATEAEAATAMAKAQGMSAAEEISLDQQIKKGSTKGIASS